MNDDNYWYGAPKAGDFNFEVQVFGERFKEAFKTITGGIEDAMREVMLNSTLTVLYQERDKWLKHRNLIISDNAGTWYDNRVMRLLEVDKIIEHYIFVILDLEKVRKEWMSKKSKT